MVVTIKLFWKIFSALLFVVVCGTVLFFAYGYRYDFDEQEIQKTSIIDFQGKFAEVEVLVDGKKVAAKMPFQFKGVLPSIHEARVSKSGFHAWERKVKVDDDVVSIVDDVLLVPEDLSGYESEVFVPGDGNDLFMGDNYLLAVTPGEKVMKAVIFGEEGAISEEDIQLFNPVQTVVDTMPDQSFLLQFEDGSFSYVNLLSQSFRVFYLPLEAHSLQVDKYEGRVLFMIDDALYRTGFDRLEKGMENDLSEYLIADSVVDFEVDYYGNVFYVQDGELFFYAGAEVAEVIELEGVIESDDVKNIAVREAGGFRTLIVRTVSDQRFLYWFEQGGELQLLCGSLRGVPFYAGSGVIAYVMESGEVFTFDPVKEKKRFVFQDSETEYEIVGWYAGWNYLVLRDATGEVSVKDLFNENSYVLKQDFVDGKVQSNNYSVYLFDKGVLAVQYFEEAMRDR